MKIFSSLASLDQIRGSPLGPMLREIIIRMLGHFEYSPEYDGFVVLMEPGDVDRVLTDLCLPYRASRKTVLLAAVAPLKFLGPRPMFA